MDLDRLGGDEERLSDLAIRTTLGRQLGDAPFTRRERLDAAQSDAAGARAGGKKLGLGKSALRRDQRGPAAMAKTRAMDLDAAVDLYVRTLVTKEQVRG